MKTTQLFTIALAVSTLLASCAKETIETDPTAVRFGTNITLPAAAVRASDNIWSVDDPMGIFMLKDGQPLAASAIAEAADNRFYKSAAAGSGAVALSPNAADQTIYYPMDGSTVDFIAYYPRRATGTGADQINAYVYPINVADQSTPYKIDLLWASATTGVYNKANAGTAVALSFAHKLTSLRIRIDAAASTAAGVTDLTGMTVSIKGLKVTAPFTLATGVVGAATGVATPITPRLAASLSYYEAILLPTTVAVLGDVTVDFTIGTEVFTWKVPANIQLQEGIRNTYTITLSHTAVTATGSIINWVVGTGSTGMAE